MPAERFEVGDLWVSSSQKRLRALPRLVTGAVRLVWRSDRVLYICSTGLQLASSGFVLIEFLVLKSLVHRLLERQVPSFSHFVPDLIILAAAATVGVFASEAQSELQQLLGELVARYATNQVIEVANAVDLVTFEQPLFHDRLLRAHLNATLRPYQMASGLLGLASSVFAAAGLAVVLLLLQPLFLLLIAAAFTPAWLATAQASRLLYKFGVDQTERDRRRQYFFALMARREEAAELRAFNLGGFFHKKHGDLYADRLNELRGLIRRRLVVNLAGSAATSILTSATIATLILFVATHRISVASAGVAAGAVLLLGSRLAALAGSLGTLYESALFIEDFNGFVAALPTVRQGQGTGAVPQEFGVIEFTDVKFRYPSRPAPSLTGINLEIRSGEVIALVGENGSGKTTLAKLVAGLYQPSSGVIAWDGLDVTTLDPVQLRQRSAVIMQDFIRFHLRAGENIGLGRHEELDDLERITAAAEKVGADSYIRQLPNGYDSLLGVQYEGGSELSLGQWQRLALARTFFRDAPLVVLDEPTASLDARAEYEIFRDIRRVFAERSVVLVSHRFANVRLADRIFVLKDGQIIERGNHDELMSLSGHYAGLFNLQAAGYGA